MCWNPQIHAGSASRNTLLPLTTLLKLAMRRPLPLHTTIPQLLAAQQIQRKEMTKEDIRRRKYGWRVTPPKLCEPPAGTRMHPALFVSRASQIKWDSVTHPSLHLQHLPHVDAPRAGAQDTWEGSPPLPSSPLRKLYAFIAFMAFGAAAAFFAFIAFAIASVRSGGARSGSRYKASLKLEPRRVGGAMVQQLNQPDCKPV